MRDELDQAEPLLSAEATRPPRRQRPRRSRPRPKTIAPKQMTRESLRIGALMFPPVEGVERPRTRRDCLSGGCNEQRPCPWVSCRHHLALEVNPATGAIKVVFPDLNVEDLAETCVLDVADRGELTLDEAGALLNVVRERVRQIEVRALLALQARDL